jgi:hypothetical protein
MYWIWKIYKTKQFREIIYTKFREMYRYLKNLHNKTISRNNLYKISRNFVAFREISRNKVQWNFAEFREIKITFVVIYVFREIKKSYFATTLPPGIRHTYTFAIAKFSNNI